VANRMFMALTEVPIYGEVPRVSAGLACGLPGDDFQSVLEQADHAMYKAKRAGGTRYEIATAIAPESRS
jgi:PleD family two-component response regulator